MHRAGNLIVIDAAASGFLAIDAEQSLIGGATYEQRR